RRSMNRTRTAVPANCPPPLGLPVVLCVELGEELRRTGAITGHLMGLCAGQLVAVVPHEQLLQRRGVSDQRAYPEVGQCPNGRVDVVAVDIESHLSGLMADVVDAIQTCQCLAGL